MAFLGPSLRRKKVTDRPAARVATAALASLALNAILLLLVARLGAFEPMKLGKREQVALAPLTADQWNANRAIAGLPPGVATPRPPERAPERPSPPAPADAPRPPPPEERQPKGQVVDVAPSPDSRAPDSSRFLSDRNNRVEKETRSRWGGTEVFEKRAPAPIRGGNKPRQDAGEGGTAKESREAKAGEGGTNGKAGKEGPARKPAQSTDGQLAMLERPQEPGLLGPGQRQPRPGEGPSEHGEEGLGTPGAPGERQEGQKKLGDPRLLPSVQSMSRITAGPSSDYIDRDVEEGEETALNTREFKFATFWNRFKQNVVEHWRPAVIASYSARDPDGTIFGNRERATALRIVLGGDGSVRDIKVLEPSGLDFLDRAAVKSVREASPFYNVPPALLDSKGELAFEFMFVVVSDRAIPVRPQYHPGFP